MMGMRRVVLQVVFPMLFVISLAISFYSSYIISILDFIEVAYNNQLVVINRKSMFIFFNAILLFIARDSGLLLAPSPAAAAASNMRSPLPQTDEVEVKATVVVEEEAKVEINVRSCLELVVAEEESDQEMAEDVDVEAIVEVDELNRRCEEFIEKIKRERLIEAKQFVMVC